MGRISSNPVKAWTQRLIGLWIHVNTENWIESSESRWPGRWGPQGMRVTSGRGLARVEPACVQTHFSVVWHVQGRAANQRPAVVPSSRRGKNPPVRRKEGRAGLPARVSGRHVVWGRQSSPVLECAQVTGKDGENGQNSGEMGSSSPWTRPSAPRCGDTHKVQRAPSVRPWVEIVLENGSGVAIDWVTGRSYSEFERDKNRDGLRILLWLQIMLENSRKDIGLCTWIRKEVERNSRKQTKWRMGRCRWNYDD